MGIETVRDKMPEKINLIDRIIKLFRDNQLYWLIILLLLAATIATIILKLWAASLILVSVSLAITIYSGIIVNRRINKYTGDISELHELIEKKDSYISDFSHRIRTPLNNLPLINDLLSELNVRDKRKELLDTLISSTNNMISALNELTMRAAGEISIEPRKNIRFDLRRTIDNTIELLDIESAGNKLLDISWDNKIKREYAGDPIAIKQILIDIFSLWSALPASEQPDVNIHIRAKSQDEKNDVIEFIIESNNMPSENYIIPSREETDRRLSVKIINLMGGQHSYKTGSDKMVFSFSLPLDNVSDREPLTAVGEKIRKLDTVIG
ncbi:MAG: HAMP domain-containing histidine kinase, partial [Bacteroidales bacterium]|nr:HAMP domain-containing histidine kinase [Bacteroidales bacterium]